MDQQRIESARAILKAGGKSASGVTSAWLSKRLGEDKDTCLEILQAIRDHAEAPEPVVTESAKLKRENEELKRRLREAIEKRVLEEKYESFITKAASRPASLPDWVRIPKSNKSRQGTPIAHLSDAHFDEVVEPEQIEWTNGFNRRIGEMRLERFFQNTIKLCDEYLKGLHYPGIVLPISGDMFSGNIHDELRETNEDSLCGSLVHWLGPLESGISMLADHFGKVYIPVVVGNHPRGTMKPRAKGAVRDNFDWLLAKLMERDFAKDKRVEFNVSESFDCNFSVYSTRYRQTHGDQFKGGSGIAAELSPMMIGEARKRARQQAINDPFDVLIMGHWHTRQTLSRSKCNGSLKGYDEYAYRNNFKWQPPLQSLWITDPKDGVTIEAPIHVQCENEGWEGKAREKRPSFAA
jgi:hypothetical protein